MLTQQDLTSIQSVIQTTLQTELTPVKQDIHELKKITARHTTEIQNIQTTVVSIIQNMATKGELKDIEKKMATKEELKHLEEKMVTKDELKHLEKKMATKDELRRLEENMATNNELRRLEENMATKDELRHLEENITAKMATKDELRRLQENMTAKMATKEDVLSLKKDMQALSKQMNILEQTSASKIHIAQLRQEIIIMRDNMVTKQQLDRIVKDLLQHIYDVYKPVEDTQRSHANRIQFLEQRVFS